MFAASAFLFRGLFVKKNLRPRVVWVHVFLVTALTFVWRFIVLLMASPDLFPEAFTPAFLEWVQPINQMMYSLNAASLMLLTAISQRSRNGDE